MESGKCGWVTGMLGRISIIWVGMKVVTGIKVGTGPGRTMVCSSGSLVSTRGSSEVKVVCKVGLVAVAAVGLPLGATIGIEGRTGISNVIVINGALSGVRTGIGINIGSTSMHIWLGLEVLAWVHALVSGRICSVRGLDVDGVLGMKGADGATEMGAIGVSKPTIGIVGSDKVLDIGTGVAEGEANGTCGKVTILDIDGNSDIEGRSSAISSLSSSV